MQCKKWIHIGAWLMSSLGSLDPFFWGRQRPGLRQSVQIRLI